MLKIEYQFKVTEGREMRAMAFINADNAASWLLQVTQLYGKVGIISVHYHD